MIRKLSKLLGIALTITLLTSLLSVAAPAAAIDQPTVTLSNKAISNASEYVIRFVVSENVTDGDTITIQFDKNSTTKVANPGVTGTVNASFGWYGVDYAAAVTTNVAIASDSTNKKVTITMGAGDKIGEGAEIRVALLTGITNPAEIGDYTLTVATTNEDTPVTSAAYSVTAPYVAPLAGTVEVYNPAGIKVGSKNGDGAIQYCLDKATTPGYTVKVGTGTYTENLMLASGGVTIMATGAAEETIVKGEWTIDKNDVGTTTELPNVIQGMTLEPQANSGNFSVRILNTGNLTTVKDCIIRKASVFQPDSQGPEDLIFVNASRVTISNCTIETSAGKSADTAIIVAASDAIYGVTISGCTIDVDASAAYVDDIAIDVQGAGKITVDGCTITGNSGVGYRDNSGTATVATVKNSTLTGLVNAVTYNNNNGAAKLTLISNTISGCTTTPNSTAVNAKRAIDLIDYQNVMTIQKNTIKDNAGYAIVFGDLAAANTTATSFTGNILSGNVYGTKNADTGGGTLKAILNYWGDNSGPTIDDNPGGIGDPIVSPTVGGGAIEYRPWTNTSTTELAADQDVPANGTLDKSTTIGVAYQSTGAVAGVSLMRYASNPQAAAPPGVALDGGFYDVYSPNATNVGALGETTILFFNDTINEDTKAYYYSELQKVWVMCSDQDVAGNGAYVYVTIKNTGTEPSSAELNGTVFALTQQKSIPDAPVINTPSIGATDISIEPMFTWDAVDNAVRYEISVADDPSFTFLTLSHNVEGITFYKADADNEEALDYDTTYYWRVRAVLEESYSAGTPATAYQVGIFTTEAEPVEVVDNTGEQTIVTVEPTKPEVNVEIPPTKITVEPAGAAIPTYILWIIVVVGAVLIIALIVLIVRTRRVA
jgi:hypothetical protein